MGFNGDLMVSNGIYWDIPSGYDEHSHGIDGP